MISDEHSLVLIQLSAKEFTTRIGIIIKKNKDQTMIMIDAVYLSSNGTGVTYLFLSDVTKNTPAFRFKICSVFKEYKLDDNMNYQQYLVTNRR